MSIQVRFFGDVEILYGVGVIVTSATVGSIFAPTIMTVVEDIVPSPIPEGIINGYTLTFLDGALVGQDFVLTSTANFDMLAITVGDWSSASAGDHFTITGSIGNNLTVSGHASIGDGLDIFLGELNLTVDKTTMGGNDYVELSAWNSDNDEGIMLGGKLIMMNEGGDTSIRFTNGSESTMDHGGRFYHLLLPCSGWPEHSTAFTDHIPHSDRNPIIMAGDRRKSAGLYDIFPAAGNRHGRCIPGSRSVPVLRVLGIYACADVFPDRNLGWQAAHLCSS